MSVSLDLVVDTSRKGLALGLFSESSDFVSPVLYEPTARGEMLSQKLDQLLVQTQASLSQVKRVMVALGPGTFTGLPTGMALSNSRDLQSPPRVLVCGVCPGRILFRYGSSQRTAWRRSLLCG